MPSLINDKFKDLISDDKAVKKLYKKITTKKAGSSSCREFKINSGNKSYTVNFNKTIKRK